MDRIIGELLEIEASDVQSGDHIILKDCIRYVIDARPDADQMTTLEVGDPKTQILLGRWQLANDRDVHVVRPIPA